MPSRKKIIIITSIISVIAIASTVIYLQYLKLMNYVITFKSVKAKTITDSLVSIDLIINLNNKSDVSFDITSQLYTIYINGKQIAKIGNSDVVKIAKGDNTIPLAIAFNPKKVLNDSGGTQGLISFLLSPDKLKITIDTKLYVKFYSFNIAIPYVYNTTIKELLASNK